MYFVYILNSTHFPKQYYYGSTKNLKSRLKAHNNGKCRHTSKYKPWRIRFCAAFETKKLAQSFEKYLKSASGRAFLKNRLVSQV